jgi:hypothetical protein
LTLDNLKLKNISSIDSNFAYPIILSSFASITKLTNSIIKDIDVPLIDSILSELVINLCIIQKINTTGYVINTFQNTDFILINSTFDALSNYQGASPINLKETNSSLISNVTLCNIQQTAMTTESSILSNIFRFNITNCNRGILFASGSSLVFQNSTFAHCGNNTLDGGALLNINSDLDIRHSIFISNNAKRGAGIYFS